jgi:hypothetical protein
MNKMPIYNIKKCLCNESTELNKFLVQKLMFYTTSMDFIQIHWDVHFYNFFILNAIFVRHSIFS